jgi:hypothetical protein
MRERLLIHANIVGFGEQLPQFGSVAKFQYRQITPNTATSPMT